MMYTRGRYFSLQFSKKKANCIYILPAGIISEIFIH